MDTSPTCGGHPPPSALRLPPHIRDVGNRGRYRTLVPRPGHGHQRRQDRRHLRPLAQADRRQLRRSMLTTWRLAGETALTALWPRLAVLDYAAENLEAGFGCGEVRRAVREEMPHRGLRNVRMSPGNMSEARGCIACLVDRDPPAKFANLRIDLSKTSVVVSRHVRHERLRTVCALQTQDCLCG